VKTRLSPDQAIPAHGDDEPVMSDASMIMAVNFSVTSNADMDCSVSCTSSFGVYFCTWFLDM